ASIANATRSSGRASTSDPFFARPIGVRAAATITASDKGTLACQSPTDDQLLHLARPLVQCRNAGIPEVLPDGILVDVTVAAVHLDGGVRGAYRRLTCVELRHRRLERVRAAGVGQRRRLPGQQPCRLRL